MLCCEHETPCNRRDRLKAYTAPDGIKQAEAAPRAVKSSRRLWSALRTLELDGGGLYDLPDSHESGREGSSAARSMRVLVTSIGEGGCRAFTLHHLMRSRCTVSPPPAPWQPMENVFIGGSDMAGACMSSVTPFNMSESFWIERGALRRSAIVVPPKARCFSSASPAPAHRGSDPPSLLFRYFYSALA